MPDWLAPALLALYGPVCLAYGLWLGMRINFAARRGCGPPRLMPRPPDLKLPDFLTHPPTDTELRQANDALGETELEGPTRNPAHRWSA